ncbi:hypothetical protein AB0M95_38870 [Sphaerisporangium sp. NPDC051017]|uniref:hypothetical protein n=1 Tax=unclassified Sphaerisporangium TaxID=2630420 RepID=UPI0033EFFCE5
MSASMSGGAGPRACIPQQRASRAAERLHRELAELSIHADINTTDRVALLSVWAGLLVWVRNGTYSWWSGRFDGRGNCEYASGPVGDPVTAARRVAARYVELRDGHPDSARVMEVLNHVPEPLEIPRVSDYAIFGGHRRALIAPV